MKGGKVGEKVVGPREKLKAYKPALLPVLKIGEGLQQQVVRFEGGAEVERISLACCSALVRVGAGLKNESFLDKLSR
jgi:hypothetical protein